MPLNDSERPGCVVNAAWKTSTISGWRTVHKRCPNSAHTFTRSSSYVSMKLTESATDSFFPLRKAQLSRLSRKCTKIGQWKK